MTREQWLKTWGFEDGTPAADEAWEEKLAFVPIRLNPLIMSDLAPYQAMGVDVETGKAPMITSRSRSDVTAASTASACVSRVSVPAIRSRTGASVAFTVVTTMSAKAFASRDIKTPDAK